MSPKPFTSSDATKAKQKIMKLLDTHKACPSQSPTPVCWNVGGNQLSFREYVNIKGYTSKICLKFNGTELTKAFSEAAIEEALTSVIQEPEEPEQEEPEQEEPDQEERRLAAVEQTPSVQVQDSMTPKEWAQSVIDVIEPLYNTEADFTLKSFEYGPFRIMFERLTCMCGQANMHVTAKKDKSSPELQEGDMDFRNCDMETVPRIFNQAFEIVLPNVASFLPPPRTSRYPTRKRPLGEVLEDSSSVGYCAVLSSINEHLVAQDRGIAVKASIAATNWWNAEFQVRLDQGRTPREVSLELDGEYGAKLKEIEDEIKAADTDLIAARDELVRAINAASAAFNHHKAILTNRS